MSRTRDLGAFLSAVALLAGCGGGGDDAPTSAAPSAPAPAPAPAPTPAPGPAPAPTPAPGGLYVGYYQEDPVTNPEDPVPGAFSLSIPASDGTFSGSMYFTYLGCQTSNVGNVSGTRTGDSLTGTWSGTIDNALQLGTYTGRYDAASQAFSGTYVNAGGKQLRDLSPCIRYTIAPKGTWEMFPIDSHVPSTFAVSIDGRTVSWSATTGAAITLVYVLDPAIAQTSGNPVLWQTVVSTATTITVPASVALQAAHEYVAVVGIGDSSYQRRAFGSARFTP